MCGLWVMAQAPCDYLFQKGSYNKQGSVSPPISLLQNNSTRMLRKACRSGYNSIKRDLVFNLYFRWPAIDSTAAEPGIMWWVTRRLGNQTLWRGWPRARIFVCVYFGVSYRELYETFSYSKGLICLKDLGNLKDYFTTFRGKRPVIHLVRNWISSTQVRM